MIRKLFAVLICVVALVSLIALAKMELSAEASPDNDSLSFGSENGNESSAPGDADMALPEKPTGENVPQAEPESPFADSTEGFTENADGQDFTDDRNGEPTALPLPLAAEGLVSDGEPKMDGFGKFSGGVMEEPETLDFAEAEPPLPTEEMVETPLPTGDMTCPEAEGYTAMPGEEFTLAIPVRYTHGDNVYDSHVNGQRLHDTAMEQEENSFSRALTLVLSHVEITLLARGGEDFPLTGSAVGARRTLLANGVNYGYAVFENLQVREDAAPGAYPIGFQVAWTDLAGVLFEKEMTLTLTVSPHPVLGEITLGEYAAPEGRAGGMLTLAVPVRYTQADIAWESNASPESETVPYAPDEAAEAFDQSLTDVLSEVSLSFVPGQQEYSPLKPEDLAQSRALLTGGQNLGYAVFDDIPIQTDAVPGEYPVLLDAVWKDASGNVGTQRITAMVSVAMAFFEDGPIVYTFAELKSAIQSGAYDKIYLGYSPANAGKITYTQAGGIEMPSSLNHLEIVGTDPITGERMILEDYGNGFSFYESDTLRTTRNGQSILLRDVDVIGKNCYGILFTRHPLVSSFTFQNVSYTGIGMSKNYAAGSLVTFIDCDVTLTDTYGYAEDVASVFDVTFYGENTMVRKSSAANNRAMFFMYGRGTFHVAPKAKLRLETNLYAINTADDSTMLIDGEMTVTAAGSDGGMTPVTLMERKVRTLTITREGSLSLRYSGSRDALRVQHLIVQGELDIEKTTGSGPCLTIAEGGNARFESPRRVSLSNTGGAVLQSVERGPASLHIEAQALNRVTANDIWIWNNNDMEAFTVSASLLAGGGTAVLSTTNLEGRKGAAYGARELNTAAFNLATAGRLIFGECDLTINPVYAGSSTVTGFAPPSSAQTIVEYPLNGGQMGREVQSAEGEMIGGQYRAVQWQPVLGDTSRIYVKNTYRQLQAHRYTDSRHTCTWQHVPDRLVFQPAEVLWKPQVIGRADPVWTMEVLDTKTGGSGWKIYARADNMATKDGTDTLLGTMAFVTGGQPQVLSAQEQALIAEQPSGAAAGVTTLSWGEAEGPHIYLEAEQGIPGKTYETTITWSLVIGV